MQVLTYKKQQGYIVKLRGELDAKTAEDVEKILDEIIKLDPEQIHIDCKELKYISSRGLGIFVARYHEIQEKKIQFSLFNMGPSIKNVFKILGLDEIITINPESAYAHKN
jgi:anti-sigma B factor antagonist